jgi:hypothetical protein
MRLIRIGMLALAFGLCVTAGVTLGMTQHGATIMAVVAMTTAALAIVVECVEKGMWS